MGVSRVYQLRDVADLLFSRRKKKLRKGTIAEYQRLFASQVFDPLRECRVSRLSSPRICAWHSKCGRRAPVQANRALSLLKVLLKFAVVELGVLDRNPAEGVCGFPEAPRRVEVTPDEIRNVLAAAEKVGGAPRVFLRLLIFTGSRCGEISSARWEHVAADYASIVHPLTKTTPKKTFMGPAGAATLRSWHAECGAPTQGLVFPGLNPTVVWRRIRRITGCKGLRLHDLRHVFASAGLEAGLPLKTISGLLNHSSVRTTEIYARTHGATLRTAVAVVEGQMTTLTKEGAVPGAGSEGEVNGPRRRSLSKRWGQGNYRGGLSPRSARGT